MPALRTMWMMAAVLCLLPATALAQQSKQLKTPEEQAFLQDRIEKRLLNIKDKGRKDPKYAHPYWHSLSSLRELPKGYTTLLKLHELYRSRAAKSPEEKIEGATWATWQARCLYELSIHPAVAMNLEHFPTELIAEYCDINLPQRDDEKAAFRIPSIDFISRLGPRAKVALPRMRELVNHEDDAVALAAFRAIKKIAPAP